MITDELIEAACEGDKAAKAAVTEWIYEALWVCVRAQVPAQDREDVHHDTLHDILRKMPTEAPRQAKEFRQWVFGFGHMGVREHRGRRKRKREVVGLEPDMFAREETSLLEAWHRYRLLGLLSTLLRKLPRIYRSPIIHRLRGRRDTSFADQRGLAKGTVRWRRYEGRKWLKRMLERFMSGADVLSAQPDSPSTM